MFEDIFGSLDNIFGPSVIPTGDPFSAATYGYDAPATGYAAFDHPGQVIDLSNSSQYIPAVASALNLLPLLGAGIGGIAGGLSGGSKPAGTITGISDVPDWLKPVVINNLNSAHALIPQASQAFNVVPQAQDMMARTMRGDFVNPATNPYFQPYATDLSSRVGSQFNSIFGGSTTWGTSPGGVQDNFNRAFSSATQPLYSSAYNFERGNQLNAATNAPAFAGQSAQAAFSPYTSFANLFPSVGTKTVPYFQDRFGSAAGGALAGATLGNNIFGTKQSA